MNNKLYHGFLDESGILEKTGGAGNYFVISVIVVGDLSELKRTIKFARQEARGKFKFHTVFKANKENEGFIRLVLHQLAKRNISIIVGIWEKDIRGIRVDKNRLYTGLVAQTVKMATDIYPKLHLVIHKRFTSPHLQNQLSKVISGQIQIGASLFLNQQTEVECRELELADAVAWAIFQKYNNKRSGFYDIIKNKIIKENRLAA
jgi:hypothetical protein